MSQLAALTHFSALASLGGPVAVVRVEGEVDLATAPQMERVLADVPADGPVVLDLTGCPFLDSSGIAALLRAQGRLRAGGGRVVVARRPGGAVDRALVLCLGPRVGTAASVEDAIRLLRP